MANQKHLELILQGVDVWNAWIREHPMIQPDLNGADLSRTSLTEANLYGANLFKTSFTGADLTSANLFRANLNRANLSGANLSIANLSNAHLIGANLNGANLNGTNFSRADLSNADLSGADLSGVVLDMPNESKEEIYAMIISGANLGDAVLDNANFSGAILGWTQLGDHDLRSIKGLETIVHRGPSPLSINTIYLSEGNIPEAFIRGTGAPNIFIDYVRSLIQKPIEYYTCFISYSSKDDEFAHRLHADLQHHGVSCWFAAKDMEIGDKIRPRIDESIRRHDKLLLVLSKHALQSTWVAYEVEQALNKEPEGIPNVLFPIRLDQAAITCQEEWARDIRRTRHIGDFTHWKDHDQYQQSFARLLSALKQSKTQS